MKDCSMPRKCSAEQQHGLTRICDKWAKINKNTSHALLWFMVHRQTWIHGLIQNRHYIPVVSRMQAAGVRQYNFDTVVKRTVESALENVHEGAQTNVNIFGLNSIHHVALSPAADWTLWLWGVSGTQHTERGTDGLPVYLVHDKVAELIVNNSGHHFLFILF